VSGVQRLENALATTLAKLKTHDEKETLLEVIGHDIERLKNMERFQEMYKYIGFFYENPASLLDYLPESGVVIVDEMSRVQESANHLDTEEAEWYSSLLASNQMVQDSKFSFDWNEIWEHTDHQRIYMSVFLRHIPNTQPQNIVNLSTRAMQTFHGQMNLFKNELKRWEKGDFSVVILAPNDERAEKIHSIFMDYEIEANVQEQLTFPANTPAITVGNITSGIEMPMHKLVIITENELFKQRTKR